MIERLISYAYNMTKIYLRFTFYTFNNHENFDSYHRHIIFPQAYVQQMKFSRNQLRKNSETLK
jgi:hypothetical protein